MRSQNQVRLNEEQTVASNAIHGVYVCLAGPGSGKTTVLTYRQLNMMAAGISNNDILNLTFTHSAATEMASRIGFIGAAEIFRTFHSFALELIKKEKDKLPFPVCETVIPVELQDYHLLFELADSYRGMITWRTLQEKITAWKCSAISPDRAIEESSGRAIDYYYAQAYKDYERRCREQGWLDFSSLMEEAVKLLETNEEVRNRYKKKFIAVDEAQDCDELQFKLLQLLFEGNLFAVGDENQLIYEWRNAKSGNLSNFARFFPGAKVIYLGTNHRSSSTLVDFFKEILPVDNGLASHMTTYNPTGPEITISRYADDEHEAGEVLKKIKDPEHAAIIARTNRQLFLVQRICAMRGVKTVFLGKKDLWDQAEVKKLLDYLKKESKTKEAHAALKDIIAQNNMIALYSRIGTANPMEANPIENINSIVKIAAGKGTASEFLDYIRRLTYARKSTATKALSLTTVHQAKGREWDEVYLIGAGHGIMPHKDGETPEESRIFFVACSRAAKELHISYYGPLSMFLSRYDSKVKDFCKI